MATVTRPAQYECLARDRTMTTTPICPAPAGAPEQRLAPEPLTPIILTAPEEFRDWLRTLAPTDVCGQPQWSNGCPLARYLRVRNGCPYEEASVECDRYTLGRARYPLPAWAQLFVARVDHVPAYLEAAGHAGHHRSRSAAAAGGPRRQRGRRGRPPGGAGRLRWACDEGRRRASPAHGRRPGRWRRDGPRPGRHAAVAVVAGAACPRLASSCRSPATARAAPAASASRCNG